MDEISIKAPVIASHNDYLSDQTAAIRSKTIPWEGYQKAGLISVEELASLRQYESATELNGTYVTLFLTLLAKLTRTDTIQGILVLMDDFITRDASLFLKLAGMPAADLLATLCRLLKHTDEYVQLKSAKIIVSLLLEVQKPLEFYPKDLLAWIASQLVSSNTLVVDIAVQYSQSLLTVPAYRLAFYNDDAFGCMVSLLKKPSIQAQMQYQIINCVWVLTFEVQVAQDLQKRYAIASTLIEIVKSAIKEKVVRMIVASFKNMIALAPSQNLIPLLGCKLLPAADNLVARKWTDPEIMEDLSFIRDELVKNVASLTTFDEYASEVQSERLEWSPPHQSEQFWKSNAAKLNDHDSELLKTLCKLLKSPTSSPQTLAIAAHDIGQYVKYVQELGAKTQVMILMSHSDSDVRYHALAAVQYSPFMLESLCRMPGSINKRYSVIPM